MGRLRRAEIWQVQLRGTEVQDQPQGAETGTEGSPDRPCIIISADRYNSLPTAHRVSVAIVTNRYGKDPRTGQRRRKVLTPWDTVSDPSRIEIKTTDTPLTKESIFRSFQIKTIFASEATTNLPNQLWWNRRRGRAPSDLMSLVDSKLLSLFEGDRSVVGVLGHRQGDVLEAIAPNGGLVSYLVVSVNEFSEFTAARDRPLVIAVRLEESRAQGEIVPGTTMVEVEPTMKGRSASLMRANCQEVGAIDPRNRGAGKYGRVTDLRSVLAALGDYLDLPLFGARERMSSKDWRADSKLREAVERFQKTRDDLSQKYSALDDEAQDALDLWEDFFESPEEETATAVSHAAVAQGIPPESEVWKQPEPVVRGSTNPPSTRAKIVRSISHTAARFSDIVSEIIRPNSIAFDPTRRVFVIGLTGGFAFAAVEASGIPIAWLVDQAQASYNERRKLHPESDPMAALREMFRVNEMLRGQSRLAYYAAGMHADPRIPSSQYGFPHDVDALLDFRLLDVRLPEARPAGQITDLNSADHVVVAGSPTSSEEARHYLPHGSMDASEFQSNVYNAERIPYHFLFSKEERVSVISRSLGGKEKPASRKALRISRSGEIWQPENYSDRGGRLETDFLMVSRLPRSLTSGDVILLTGGHGAAASAFGLLFDRRTFPEMRTLSDALRGARYFQFVLEVPVEHREQATMGRIVRIAEKAPPVVIAKEEEATARELLLTKKVQ